MIFQKIRQQISVILTYIFPSTRVEGILFFLLLLLYIPLGIYLALHATIIYNKDIPWDIYFSFDTSHIIISGGMIEKHPFSYYFIATVYMLAAKISNLVGDIRYFSLSFAVFCALNVSLGIVQIFKYLNNIIRLNRKTSFLLIIFYAFFSTNILLSFTPETYTFSIFLLSLYTYITAFVLNKGKKISVFVTTGMGIFIGGETITNLSKVFIPVLFENKKYNLKTLLGTAIKVFVSIGIFILLYLWRRDWDYIKILSKSTSQYEKFSNPKGDAWWDMVTSYFFGGNVLFPSFEVKEIYYLKVPHKALYYSVYNQPIQYIFCVFLFICMIWALWSNRKNKLVYILWLSFLIDIIIHCFMKFGIWISFIYGGHWVFVVPLLIGWLFHAYQSSKRIYRLLSITLITMTAYLIINNLFRMTEFIHFVNNYYIIK